MRTRARTEIVKTGRKTRSCRVDRSENGQGEIFLSYFCVIRVPVPCLNAYVVC